MMHARMGSKPLSVINTAAIMPPIVKLPSQVRSAKSSNLNETYTPIASTAQKSP